MPRQVVVAFVAGSPIEIAHMVTDVLDEQKGLVVLEELIPFAAQPLSADFIRANQHEPEAHRRLAFVCYAVFVVADQVVFDSRSRIHTESLGLIKDEEGPASTQPVDHTRVH